MTVPRVKEIWLLIGVYPFENPVALRNNGQERRQIRSKVERWGGGRWGSGHLSGAREASETRGCPDTLEKGKRGKIEFARERTRGKLRDSCKKGSEEKGGF